MDCAPSSFSSCLPCCTGSMLGQVWACPDSHGKAQAGLGSTFAAELASFGQVLSATEHPLGLCFKHLSLTWLMSPALKIASQTGSLFPPLPRPVPPSCQLLCPHSRWDRDTLHCAAIQGWVNKWSVSDRWPVFLFSEVFLPTICWEPFLLHKEALAPHLTPPFASSHKLKYA